MLHIATTYVLGRGFRKIAALGLILLFVILWVVDAQATPGTGNAVIILSDDVPAGSTGTWRIEYTALEAFVTGVIEVTIPDNWTAPQILNPANPGFVDISTTGVFSSPDSIDIDGNVITVSIASLSIGGTVDIVYGDVSGDPGGAAFAQTTAQDDVTFQVSSNPLGQSPVSPLSSGSPSVDVVAAAPDQIAVTPVDTTVAAGYFIRFTIRVEDQYDNPSPVASAQTCTLYASGGNYYDTGDHVTPVTELVVSAGTSSAQIDYMHTAMGNYFLAFSDNDGISPNLGFEATEIDIVPSDPDPATSSIEGDKPTVYANGTDTLEVTVTVRDEFGNPVDGVTVTIDATDTYGGNSYTQPGATVADGTAVGYLSSTKAEPKIVRAYIDGTTQIVDTLEVEFVAGLPSLATSLISVDPPSITADDEDTLTVTVTVLDANGNPVEGSYVTIEATGTGNRYVAPGTTGPDGVAVGYMFSTVAESKTVSFRIGGSLAVNTASADFIAGDSDSSMSGIDADPLSVTADGIEATTVTVSGRDAYGNAVSGSSVVLTVTGTENTITQPGMTDGNGEAVGYVRSTKAEQKRIDFTIDGTPADSFVTVDFIAGAVDSSISDIAAEPLSVTADSIQATTVTVTALDANGNIVIGSDVQITASGIDNTITQPSAPTDENGEAVGYVRSTKAETKTIGFIIDSAPADSTTEVEFLPGDVNYSLSSIAGDRDTVSANGLDTLTVTITALDKYSNPVPGKNVTLEVNPSRPENEIIQPGSTDANGIAVGYVLSTVVEEKYVRALIEGVYVTGQLTVLFTSDEVDPDESEVVGYPSVVSADGSDSVTVTVTARDEFRNPVPGSHVELEVDPPRPENIIINPGGTTNESGVAVGYIKSTYAEPKTITALINGVPATQTVAVEFVSGDVSASLSGISAAPSPVTANGSDTVFVTVTARDANGNPVAGKNVSLMVDPERLAPENVIIDPVGPTDENGEAVGRVLSTVAETKTIGAVIGGITIDDTVEVVFEPGPYSLSESGISVAPSSVTADGSDTLYVTVTVRDANGNPVPDQEVTLDVDPPRLENTIEDPTSWTDESGVAVGYVFSTVAESKTIGFNIESEAADDTATALFVAGDVDLANSLIEVSPPTVKADGVETLSVTVTARDAYDNPVQGETVTLEVDPARPENTITQPLVPTNAAGVAYGLARSTYAELKTVRARIGGALMPASETAQFVAGDVDYFIITHDGPATAGVPEEVTIEVLDGNDNRLESFTGTITVYTSTSETEDRISWDALPALGTITDSETDDSAEYQFAPGDSGIATLRITDLEAESITLYAEYGTVTSASASQLVVEYAAADSIFAISGDGQTAVVQTAVAAPLVVGVEDQYGNRVQEATVTFTILDGTNAEIDTDTSLPGIQLTAETDANGTAECEYWMLGEVSGIDSDRVEASIASGTTTSTVFTATALHDEIASIVLDPGDRNVTVGASISPVTATARDQFGNFVVNEYVTIFLKDPVNGSLSNDPAHETNYLGPSTRAGYTDASGRIYVIYNAPTEAGLQDVLDASHADLPASSVTDAVYTSVDAGATKLRVTVIPGDETSHAGETFTFLVEAVDDNGNRDTDDTSNIMLNPDSDGGFSFSLTDWGTTVTTANLVNGSVTLYGRGSKTGTWNIVVDESTNTLDSDDFTISIIAEDVVHHYYWVTTPDSATAGADFTVQAEAQDRFYNLVTTANYAIALHAVNALDTGQPASAELNKTSGTVVNGIYTETAMRYTVAEDIRIEITGGVPVTAYSDQIFVVHALAYQVFKVSGDATGVPAGAQVSLTARVDDGYGNPVNGSSVTFTRQTGGGSPASATLPTGIDGEVSLLYTTGTAAGDNIVRAAILDGDPMGLETQDFTITTVPQTGIDTVTVALPGTAFLAGEHFTVDIEAFDAYGNKLVNDNSTQLVPIAQNPSMTFDPAVVTLTAGDASFDAWDILAGTNSIAIRSIGGDTLSSWSPFITISPAGAHSISEVSGDSTGVIAGTSVELKARVRDGYGNNVSNEIVQFSITSNLGGDPELTDGYLDPLDGRVRTSADGIAICSLTTDVNTGDNTVDATILDGNPPEQRKTFTVSTMAGTISRYDVIPDGTTKIAGESFTATITAYDLNGNIATDDNTTQVDLSSGEGSAVFSEDPVTLTAGIAVVTVSDEVAEQLIISAETLDGGALSHSAEITILPDVPSGMIAIESITPNDTLTANGISKATLTTAPITDQYGNIVTTGTMITVSALLGEVASEDRDETTPGVQRATGVNGKVSVFILSAETPGTDTITFQSVEGSALGTATLVYAPHPDCRYDNYVYPEFVVPDNEARFRCLVRNYSETGLWLGTSSTISFSDPVGNTYTAPLEAMVFIGASQADTLDFSPVTVPTGMYGGTYSPEVNLQGTDIYGSSYSARFNAGVNSVTVSSIEIVSITNPAQVSRGDTVEVGVGVRNNSSGSYVVVQQIDVHFTQSNSVLVGGLEDWDPPLPDTLLGDTEKTYRGRVAVSVDYIGPEEIDASVLATNGTEISDPTADNAIGEWYIQSAADITYMEGSLAPMTISQGQEQSFSLTLRNDGQAGVFLDPSTTFLFFSDGADVYIVQPAQTLALPGNATTRITFPAAVVPLAMDPGPQEVVLSLRGTENGGPFDVTLHLSDSVMVTTPALISYAGTLTPSTVSKGSSVSFEVGIQNTGGAAVECIDDSTWITFGGGAYLATLDRNRGTTIAPEATTTLYFISEEIPEGLATGPYTADVRIFGTENGLPFEALITPSDDITLEDPSDLAIRSITVPLPSTVTADQTAPWTAEMIVENTGQATVSLDSLELRLFNGSTDVYEEVHITSDFVAGTTLDQDSSAAITFEFSDNASNPMTVGTVAIDATVWGTEVISQNELIANTETGGKGSYTVQTPAALAVLDVIPSVDRATANQTKDWVIDVAIRNNGQSNIDISFDTDSMFVTFSTSVDFLVIRPTELAGGGTILEGLSTDTLRFIVDQTGSFSGDCSINAFIGGTETNGLRLLPFASDPTPAHVDIESEAVLVINRLTALQDPVTLSQAREWSIEMEVTNIGESDVTVILDTLLTDSTWVTIPSGTGFSIYNTTSQFVSGGTSLDGGETKLLRFTVLITGSEPPASQEITGAIYAVEENSDRPVYAERNGSDFVMFQRRPEPTYVVRTLTPTVVSSGTSVSIELDLVSNDPDHSTIHFDLDNTTVSFNDGDGDTYSASLSPISVDTLGGGDSSHLIFESATVDPAIALQSYSVAIHLEGTENGNDFVADLETGSDDDSLKVQEASQLSIDGFILSQSSITVEQTREWQARMVVQNNGEAAVELDLDPAKTRLSFIIGGSIVTGQYDIDFPTELAGSGSDTLESGEPDTLVFTITQTGTTDGLMQVHGYIEGIDVNSEERLTDNTFDGTWATMNVQQAGVPLVAATTPERETVTSGQTTPWTFAVNVCNVGGATLTLDSLTTFIHQLDPMYTIEYGWDGEFEGGGTSLSSGECRDILFAVSPTIDRPNGEDLLLYPKVGFFEDNSGEYREYDTGLTGVNFGEIRVQAPADLSITRIENAAPRASYVNIGQRFPIAFEVVNNGEAAAGQIYISLTSDGSSSIEDTPMILPEIEGSAATIIDTFHVTAANTAGTEIFTTAIDSAVDVNSGQSDIVEMSSSPDDTTLAEIQTPGALIMTRLVPSQGEVNQDQIAEWTLTAHVENIGEAPVLLETPSESDIVFSIGVVQQTDYDVDAPTGFASGGVGFVLDGYSADSLVYTVKDTGSDTGTVDIRASLDWEDMNIPEVSQTAAFADTNVHVGRPEGLRIISVTTDAPNNELYPNTSIVNTGQVFNLIVHVENSGGDHIDSLVVEVDSNNGTEAIYTGDPYPSILSGDELDFDFSVTASDSEEVEILTARIVYAVSRNDPDNPPEALQADDNTENIRVQLPASLSVDAWISYPPGAVNDTVSVGQEFVLSAAVENEGTASVDASGQVTLTLPTNMELVDSGSEPLIRSFMPGADISWRVNAPDDPSLSDDLLVTITNSPVDVNIDPLPAAVDDGDDTVRVVTVETASIDIAVLYFESPLGATDSVLSTEQGFTIAARFTASANCDLVELELVLPTGFTPGNGLVQYVGAGSGAEDTLRWDVTAPASEVLSETISVIPRGKDEYSGISFTDTEVTIPVQVEQKAELELEYYISGPPEATDRVLSVGLVFTVRADVVNQGTAGVDTTGARLVIALPTGYTLSGAGETFAKPFWPSASDSVTWNIRAPDDPQPIPEDITVTFGAPYATDENTNESAEFDVGDAISVVTEEGQLEMTNLSDIDTIPPYVVPQESEDVPVLRIGLFNGSTYPLGLDTLYLTIESGAGQAVSDPLRYVTGIELVTVDGSFPAAVQNANPVPIIVDHGYVIADAQTDTLLICVDIARNAPAGELRFDIAESDDIVFTIGDLGGPRITAVWAGDGGDIAGHFLSGPLSVMSGDFEEYVHNYPNPFKAGSEETRIAYFMTADAPVNIRIFDLMGNLVWSKDISEGDPGATGSEPRTWCEVFWDGRNDKGQLVRNGVYLCRIQAGSRSATFKIAVAK